MKVSFQQCMADKHSCTAWCYHKSICSACCRPVVRLEESAKGSLWESSQLGIWGREEEERPCCLFWAVCQQRLRVDLGEHLWWVGGGGRAESKLQFLSDILRFTISFHFSAFLSQEDGSRIEYLLSSSASALSVAVPKHENACDDVTILLMVRALVDTLHCPKICNHLIVIAILLYCHYGTSGGESYEHVISAERDNLLNLAKCHHFSKMNQNYFIMHVLLLIFCSDNDWEPLIIFWVEILFTIFSLLQQQEC